MAVRNVRNRLGVKFTVTGVYLFNEVDEATPDWERTAQGTFTMEINASSADDAVRQVSELINRDIVVHQVALG